MYFTGLASTMVPAYITKSLFGHLGHDAQIVRNQDHRHRLFIFQGVDQLEYLGLNRNVKSRCRLIGDQQRGG